MVIKAAVIGAGPLGLLATKNLKEQGFDVTTFERRSYIGGIWQYSNDGILSVLPATVFNSSRYRCAFSDFPFAEGDDDFPTCNQMFAYLNRYADTFDLRPSFRLSSAVKDIRRVNHRWELTILNDGKETYTEQFDKLMVATGTFSTPHIPVLEGIEQFKGEAFHTINFAPSQDYKGKNVLIVGFHASSVDVCATLSKQTSNLYLSRRNGLALIPRFSPDGRTFDTPMALSFIRIQMFLERFFPSFFYWLLDYVLASTSKKSYPSLAKFNFLESQPSIRTTPPVAADQIVPLLENGSVTPVRQVKRITGPNSVELVDGTILTDIDTIIYCTGYKFNYPFMPKEWNPYPTDGEPPHLYQNIFPLHSDPEVRNSLAFAGAGASPFPGFCLLEMATQAVAQTWLGKSQLPPLSEMQAWHRANQELYLKNKREMKTNATYYPIMLPMNDWLTYLDKTAGTDILPHFSWTSWKSWSFWWTDRELYNAMSYKLLSPALFRYWDTGRRKAWAGARAQCFYDLELSEKRAKERVALKEKQAQGGAWL